MRPIADPSSLLSTLRRHRVRFILVGGVAAVIEGAPVATFDVDVVHARDERNLERLLGALRERDRRDRQPPWFRRAHPPRAPPQARRSGGRSIFIAGG